MLTEITKFQTYRNHFGKKISRKEAYKKKKDLKTLEKFALFLAEILIQELENRKNEICQQKTK